MYTNIPKERISKLDTSLLENIIILHEQVIMDLQYKPSTQKNTSTLLQYYPIK